MHPEQRLLLRCGRLFDGRDPQSVGPVDVLVEAGRVSSISPRIEPGAARVLDLRDSTLIPGMVDLDANLLPGPVSGDTGLWLYQAVALASELLSNGVTTARVLGGADERWALLDLRRAIADGVAPGSDLRVAPHALDDLLPDHGLADAARRERRNGADWISIDRRDMGRGRLDGLVHEAGDTPVSIVADSSEDVRMAIRAGARSVEAGCALDERTVKMAVERGAYLVPREGFAAKDAPGLNVCFGGRLDGGIAALARLIGPTAALIAATSTAAQCLGARDRGTITVDKRADLVAVPGDPLADPSVLGQKLLVIKEGRVQS